MGFLVSLRIRSPAQGVTVGGREPCRQDYRRPCFSRPLACESLMQLASSYLVGGEHKLGYCLTSPEMLGGESLMKQLQYTFVFIRGTHLWRVSSGPDPGS